MKHKNSFIKLIMVVILISSSFSSFAQQPVVAQKNSNQFSYEESSTPLDTIIGNWTITNSGSSPVTISEFEFTQLIPWVPSVGKFDGPRVGNAITVNPGSTVTVTARTTFWHPAVNEKYKWLLEACSGTCGIEGAEGQLITIVPKTPQNPDPHTSGGTELSTGVAKFEQGEGIIWPNPVKNEELLTLDLSFNLESCTYKVYDITGKEFPVNFVKPGKQYRYTALVNHLPTGFYFISIQGKNINPIGIKFAVH